MKIFELFRKRDESGVSGTGIVAQGVIFDNGKCVMTWLTQHTSITTYDSIDDVIAIHGHGRKTIVRQIADLRFEGKNGIDHLMQNLTQDHYEGVINDFIPCKENPAHCRPNHKYMWDQREAFGALFEVKKLKRPEDK